MRRVATIVLTFLLTMVGAIAVAHHYMADSAAEAAATLYRSRMLLVDTPWPRPPLARQFVTWIGDSTVAGLRGPSFLAKLSNNLRQDGVRGAGRALPGLDSFHYYCLLPMMLELEPDLIIVVANFRMFPRGRRSGRSVDLCSSFTLGSLLRAGVLPWHDRGITFARLLLTQALRWDLVEYWFYFLEGLRDLATARTKASIEGLIPSPPPTTEGYRRALTKLLNAYTEPLHPDHPGVAMLGATVSEAWRQGIPVIVVGLPIPYDVLEQHGRWHTEAQAKRTAVIRNTVRDNGGLFVDLHLALPASEFADRSGHFTQAGAAHIARLLEPTVRRTLGLKRKTKR